MTDIIRDDTDSVFMIQIPLSFFLLMIFELHVGSFIFIIHSFSFIHRHLVLGLASEKYLSINLYLFCVMHYLTKTKRRTKTRYHRRNNNNIIFCCCLSLLLLIFNTSPSSSNNIVSAMTTPISSSALPKNFNNRKFDLVIYGATGFTGQLAVEYVHNNYPNLKLAIAGRNRDKLTKLRDRIYGSGSSDSDNKKLPEIIVADAINDPESLEEMTSNTKVVANYAGSPYVDKALPVVKACVTSGTCYVDITGETPFQRASYDRYNKLAIQNNSLIVHSCGYDSIPSDLGTLVAAEEMKNKHSCDCLSIELQASDKTKGGASGGTIKTGMELMFGNNHDTMPGMKETKARGSYGLDPDGASGGPDKTDTVMGVEFSKLSQKYVVPFIMAGANAPVVRKSNALLNYKYGKNCTYREVQQVPSLLKGYASLLGFGFFGILLVIPPTRWLLMKYVLPKPGEGPSRELQSTGYFTSNIYAVGDLPSKPVVTAYFKSGNAGDPGYKATARMSIEASLCMVLERENCPCQKGGVVTPAVGLGMTLVDRLNKTGMEIGIY